MPFMVLGKRIMVFFAIFNKKSGSAEIRGRQIAEYLEAKLNPKSGYENDICIYVKSEPPDNYPKHSYLDVVDSGYRVEWLKKHPEIGVIAMSNSGYELMKRKLKRDDIVLIPQHHCNYERETRKRKKIETVGVVCTPASIQYSIEDLKKRFNKIGLKFKIKTDYKNRNDVVEFYKTIDIQIIWRLKDWPLKNSLKIVNACSFGIPTVAYPIICYSDMERFYVKANTINGLIEKVSKLKDGWDSERLIKKAEKYHIDNIAKLYKRL